LADQLPHATNFYLRYAVLLWGTPFVDLIRCRMLRVQISEGIAMLQLRMSKSKDKSSKSLRVCHGLSRFGLGLLAPCALRYASLPLLACPKFGRAWNSEDSEDSEQFQTSTCYQSLEAKHARILNVFFCMTHDPHESTLLYFYVFYVFVMYLFLSLSIDRFSE